MVWGTFFFHVCPFDRGGGALKLFGQWLYRTDTFKKGTSLSADHFLNLVLFLPSALEYCLDVEKLNLSAIRTVRVLRPLRAINRIPSGFILNQIRDIRIFTFFYQKGMRILVMLLLDTLPMLGNVLLLCFFVFFIFGIVGVQLWAGCLLIPSLSSLISLIENLSIIHSIACYITFAGFFHQNKFKYFLCRPSSTTMLHKWDIPTTSHWTWRLPGVSLNCLFFDFE